jgi:hypothetical protein
MFLISVRNRAPAPDVMKFNKVCFKILTALTGTRYKLAPEIDQL